ncbi:MRP family ATP-binding protein [Halobacteriales archaeon QS_5_70_15]|nr:MAG: MRP family ATP-binding protein [Halobacteriales archaeon QS_5_70_15]
MDENDVLDLLSSVEDPDLEGDIVSHGLVNDVAVSDGVVSVDLALGAPYSPTETGIAEEVRSILAEEGFEVELSASIDRGLAPEEDVLPDVKNLIAVASGKGGVGKSTVAVNLAAGLSRMGARVGLFDADVYGPNVPRMLAADQGPTVTDDETMLHKVLTQLWEDVEWGALDYMVIDLPPGTGDTQLTMLQSVPISGAVVVTTPQEVAVDDARKGLRMFGKHDTPVLGIVENMSGFRCPNCGEEHDLFGKGGGRDFADENRMPFLGELPLDPAVREGGDSGRPVVLEEGETSEAFREFVRSTADMQGIVHRRRVSDGGGTSR